MVALISSAEEAMAVRIKTTGKRACAASQGTTRSRSIAHRINISLKKKTIELNQAAMITQILVIMNQMLECNVMMNGLIVINTIVNGIFAKKTPMVMHTTAN